MLRLRVFGPPWLAPYPCLISTLFDTTATTHHTPMMFLPGCGGCRADGSDADGLLFLTLLGSHRQLAGTLPYIFPGRTQTTRTSQCQSTCHDLNGQQWTPYGSPLPAPPHKTVTRYFGLLPYAAAPGVRHHGGRRTTAAAMVGGAQFS